MGVYIRKVTTQGLRLGTFGLVHGFTKFFMDPNFISKDDNKIWTQQLVDVESSYHVPLMDGVTILS